MVADLFFGFELKICYQRTDPVWCVTSHLEWGVDLMGSN